MKNKNLKNWVSLSLVFCIFFTNISVSYAKISDKKIDEIIKPILVVECDPAKVNPNREGAKTLDDVYKQMTDEFASFIDQTTSNPSDTSSLSNTVIAKYSEYKDDMERILEKLVNKNYKENVYSNVDFGSSMVGAYDDASAKEYFTYGAMRTYNDAFVGAQKCSEIKEKYLQIAKDMMMNKLVDSANRKKAAILSEKLKAINNKLREMNSKLATLYGLFKTLSNKIICFEKNKCMAL